MRKSFATTLLMKQLRGMLVGLGLAALPLWAVPQSDTAVQTPSAVTPLAAEAPGIPHLVRFSGVIRDTAGKPLTGTVNLTFSFYRQEWGGTAMWAESQNVTLNSQGGYTVFLGAAEPSGLPADLFSDDQVRWVGVQAQLPDAAENPRVLLTGVPYALKAADSETLGGKPASAYVTTDALYTLASRSVQSAASAAAVQSSSITPALGGTGTANFVPLWINNTGTLGNSALFQSGSGTSASVGINTTAPLATLDVQGSARINGTLALPITGTASGTTGQNSQPLELSASAFNSGTKAASNQNFLWMAEPAGNNTASPTGKLNLLFGAGATTPAETGLSIASNGVMTFAHGQTFPGTGTIAGVTPGTGLTGGGKSGSVTLNVNQGVVAFQSDLKNAESTLNKSISTAQANAISTSESYAKANFLGLAGGGLNGNLTIQGPVNSGFGTNSSPVLNVVGGNGVVAGAQGQGINLKAGDGFDAGPAGSGGQIILQPGAAGALGGSPGNVLILGPETVQGNVGIVGAETVQGNVDIVLDDNGSVRGTPEQLIIRGSSNSNKQLLIGYLADNTSTNAGYGALQATFANHQNTPLLLNPFGGGVGIATFQLSGANSLTIGQGQGAALADGWATYSSRRWKTNIQTLPDALDKVERLRGVSYDLKENGKHEIGVIAEEVGAVVPEIVQWDKNGKDANGVDYSRLTALLIEAVKQQQAQIKQQQALIEQQQTLVKQHQALIREQREQMRMQQVQLNTQQTKSKLQDAQITELRSQLKTVQGSLKANGRTGSEVRTVKAHGSMLQN